VASLSGDPPAGERPADEIPMVGIPMDGWVLFAGLTILFAGLWNLFEGLLGLLWSNLFTGTPAFGSVWGWALVWLAFGVAGIGAGFSILGGRRSWGRWFGIVVVTMNALVHLASIGAYPWWSVAMIAIDVVILYALTARWSSVTADS